MLGFFYYLIHSVSNLNSFERKDQRGSLAKLLKKPILIINLRKKHFIE